MPPGGSVGVPAAFNNCSGSGCSRKAMSELGHNDCQQLTTGNSLPPNNPPPSSVSVPHTPAGTLRRGHRNLQLLRPQVRYHSDVVPILKYCLQSHIFHQSTPLDVMQTKV